jgi:hypothetical protein
MGRHTKHTRHPFRPTDEQRRQILTMTGFGIRQDEMATALQIDKKTLQKHFRRELDTGMTEANVRVVQALYNNAVKLNSVTAQVWWTKARMGWKEAQDVNIGGTNTPIAVDFRWADATPPVIEVTASDDDDVVVTFATNQPLISEC